MDQLERINATFVGRRVIKIVYDETSDEGLEITFDDGSRLQYGYSSCEGATFIDGKEIELTSLSDRNMKTESKLMLGGFFILLLIIFYSCSPDPYAKCTKYQIGYGSNTPAKFYKNQK